MAPYQDLHFWPAVYTWPALLACSVQLFKLSVLPASPKWADSAALTTISRLRNIFLKYTARNIQLHCFLSHGSYLGKLDPIALELGMCGPLQ